MMVAVTSANVACGFHAGDPTTLRRTCLDAAAAGVVVGAQVGYRDLAGFGRRFIDMDPVELAARMVRLVTDGKITAIDGSDIAVRAESLCVHGDSPGAVQMAGAVRDALRQAGITVRAFA